MKVLSSIIGIALLCGGGSAMSAEADKDYPVRSVKILVQYPPGGAPDLVARVMAAKLGESLGQSFVVENRAGASGNIATDAVAKAPPDGYTLLLASDPPITINPSLYAKLPFDPVKDLAPVTLMTASAFLILTGPDNPANSLQEFVARAKKNPGKFNFASSGAGSVHHLAGESLNTVAGLRLTHVPYRGFGPGSLDVMSGKVELMFGSVSAGVGLVKGGKMKALAVTGAKRYPGLPQVPTVEEAGFPGLETYVWFGLMAPAGTSQQIIDKLNSEILKAMRQTDVMERFSAQGLDIVGAGPAEFASRINVDSKKWAEVIKASGAKAEN